VNEPVTPQLRFWPDAASTIAPEVDHLYAFTLGISVLFSVLVAGLIITFCIRFRRGRPTRPMPAHGNLLEYGWIGALTLLFLCMFGWSALVYARIVEVPATALDVHVLAKQWMWKFQYSNGRATIDELTVPIGKPVKLVMTSQDVIHSLYVPAFRLKQDVLPFRYTTLWFTATRTGRYHLFCAEFCGTNHSRMIGWVHVLSQPAFEDWLAAAPNGPTPVTEGAQLFAQFACATCHLKGRGIAPDLSGIFGNQVVFTDGTTATADEQYLRESILNPTAHIVSGFKPIMPAFAATLSEPQVSALIDYIKTLEGNQP
jgi:cytochrome c oxidase subunit 2